MMFFVLALVAGTNKVLAQPYARPYTEPQPVACETDPLHPTAGVPYIYEMTTNAADGTWNWWATKNPEFIVGGVLATDSLTVSDGDLLDASGNYGKDGASNSVTITWSDEILNGTEFQGTPGSDPSPTFVVGYFASADATYCSDNIKIFELNPVDAFVVDVVSLDPETFLPDATNPYTYEPEQCVDEVQQATYSGGTILYDYGTNYLYFEFIAANFTEFWTPTFALTGLLGDQDVEYHFTYADPSTWGTTAPTWTVLESAVTNILVDPSVTTTEDGVSIFVRATLNNNTYETLAAQTVTMTLDGQNSLDEWDVVNDTCVDPNGPDQDDTANQIITPRPTLEDNITHINTDEPNDVIPAP